MAKRDDKPTIHRFLDRVEITETCWIWHGRTSAGGYGRIDDNGVDKQTHRYAFEAFLWPIPEGMQLDHVKARGCIGPICCNPAHLEVVTPRENTLRSTNLAAINARKTHCPKGHRYDEENTAVVGGRRVCRTCKRANDRVRRQNKKTRPAGTGQVVTLDR